MKLQDLVASDLGRGVKLEARHIDIVGILEAYSHRKASAFTSSPGALRSSIETSATIAGHDFSFEELVGAEIEVDR